MKSLRVKIQEEAAHKNTTQHVIEKDYALSYVLAGIATTPELANTLVFKGGTALKKVFFGDYRFSEDLDFSAFNAPHKTFLEDALQKAIKISNKLLNQYGPFDIQVKRNPERAPHPQGQEAFVIHVKFPWQPMPLCRIKVEVTHDEPVVMPPVRLSILHGYEETLDYQVNCYHIEEIIAEKMRALLQTHQKLVTRGWNRPRARDYYDLWYILKHYFHSLDKERLLATLEVKCKHRHVFYETVNDFFTQELVKEAHDHWQPTLRAFVRGLPECSIVLNETKLFLGEILS